LIVQGGGLSNTVVLRLTTTSKMENYYFVIP